MLAAVLLPVNDHDAAAAPLVVPLLAAPAAVPVAAALLERAGGQGALDGLLPHELGRRRVGHRVSRDALAGLGGLAVVMMLP